MAGARIPRFVQRVQESGWRPAAGSGLAHARHSPAAGPPAPVARFAPGRAGVRLCGCAAVRRVGARLYA